VRLTASPTAELGTFVHLEGTYVPICRQVGIADRSDLL